jgi:hypothetical protein
MVIAFLCVELTVEKTTACRFLEQFVEKQRVNSSIPNSNILVVPPLQKVRRRELEDWTGEATRYLREDYLEGGLLEIPGRLFKTDEPRSLRALYSEVRSELSNLRSDRPRFSAAQPR